MPQIHTPLLAVDVIIELADRPNRPIVLVRRRNPPHGWALPGGFVDVGETVAVAAKREAREETGLDVELQTLLGCYSDPRRDPRGHAVSAVFVGTAVGEPRGADDALEAGIFALHELPALAFDHGRILSDFREYRESGVHPPVDR